MSRRRRRQLGWLLCGLAPVVIVLTVYLAVQQPNSLPPDPVRVTSTPSETPLPSSLPSQSVLPGTTVRPRSSEQPALEVEASPVIAIRIPAIDLDLRVQQVSFGSEINPPFDPDMIGSVIYEDVSRGSNPGTDALRATYFAGHTWRAGHAAFNVIDTSLRDGDDVYVKTEASERLGVWLRYVVTGQELYKKGSLAHPTNSVWQIKPRLVFITCHLREDGEPQTDNRVFYAELAGVSHM